MQRGRRRRPWPTRAIALGLAALVPGCGGTTSSTPSAARESLVERARTAHFQVHADRAPDETVRAIAAALEESVGRVTRDLETGDVGAIRAEVWQDEASWFAEMERFFGRRYNATGYVTGPAVIRILAVPQVARNATHEMAHAVSLRVNPTFANNPRWLWESVALFENDELVDPRSLPYLVQGRFPTLSELDADPNASRQVYEVGYLIGEFVVARAGRSGLLRLVRANGDVTTVGFADAKAFEDAWAAFVRARYLGAAAIDTRRASPIDLLVVPPGG
jgi:hypothetical protein